ncbi:hypothetical protein WA588_000927 [Blastocystis sp. NMH]
MDNSDDVLNFDSVSEDDLGPVDRPIEVDEVSSSSDDMMSSSPEASEDEEKKDSLHAWGSNKNNYYGGIENDIDEDALELKEAKELEQDQMQNLHEEDFAVSEDEDEAEREEDAKMNLGFGIMEEEVRKDVKDLSEKELLKILRKESPEVLVMLPELQTRLKALVSDLQPVIQSASKDPAELPSGERLSATGKRVVECRTQVELGYPVVLLSYLLLKTEQRDLKEHPATRLLVKARALRDRLESLLPSLSPLLVEQVHKEREETGEEKESEEEKETSEGETAAVLEEEEAFSRPVRRVEAAKATVDGEMDSEIDSDVNSDVYSDVHDDDHSQVESGRKREREEDDDFYESMVSRREGKKQAKEERKKYLEMHVREDYLLKDGESRKATQKILKNRGMVASRPKENRNPRVKKRMRYEKALKRRKGQVAALRVNEADQYMGEKSGIRSDIIHSRQFR